MKRIFFTLIFFLLLFIPSGAVQAEEIDVFDTGININADGTIDVTERIGYNFGDLDRHGIFRTIPYIKTNSEGKRFVLDFSDISVIDETDRDYPFSRDKEDGYIQLKIGDPDKTITGAKRYTIRYTVSGALTYFSDHDELYWNVTGDEWEVPIESVLAAVRLPAKVDPKEIQISCFTGLRGSTEVSCASRSVPGLFEIITTEQLQSREGLTIVVGFPKGIVAVLEPKEYFWDSPAGQIVKTILIVLAIIAAILWYLIAPFVLVWRWWKFGRDPKPAMGRTSAWFSPPKTSSGREYRPGEVGALVDEQVDMRDISATIVDLARRGYLRILEPAKNDFHLEKTAKGGDIPLLSYESTLLSGIFSGKDLVKVKKGTLVTVVEDTKKSLYERLVTEGLFPRNPHTQRSLFTALGGVALMTGNILLAVSAFIFGRGMPRKTLAGAEHTAVALSLKNFLKSQERFLAFQAKEKLMFEKLLPYAVAFGVEKQWANRFADISLPAPSWYQGYRSGRFSSVYLVNSLDSSFSSITKAATPTSSSSGFSSGFSGGSSGGGGGGGGGGSW